jgi:hypothetical protein
MLSRWQSARQSDDPEHRAQMKLHAHAQLSPCGTVQDLICDVDAKGVANEVLIVTHPPRDRALSKF